MRESEGVGRRAGGSGKVWAGDIVIILNNACGLHVLPIPLSPFYSSHRTHSPMLPSHAHCSK